MKTLMRLFSAKNQLGTAEKVLEVISKCIDETDPRAALKRQQKTWRNYHGVYKKKYNQTIDDVLSDMD